MRYGIREQGRVMSTAVARQDLASPGASAAAAHDLTPPGLLAAPPPGQLLVPGVDDLAALVLRRCYERLEAGEAAISVQDAVAAMRLAWQIERDREGDRRWPNWQKCSKRC